MERKFNIHLGTLSSLDGLDDFELLCVSEQVIHELV